MRIGVVGDIHENYYGLVQAIQEMGSINRLFFTGDGYRDIERLRAKTNLPIDGVIGNCDFYSEYPAEQVLSFEHYKVLLTHGHLYGVKTDLNRLGYAGRELNVQLIVFGHTHQPLSTEWYGIKLFNPGSLSVARSYRGPSYGIIELTDKGIYSVINQLNK